MKKKKSKLNKKRTLFLILEACTICVFLIVTLWCLYQLVGYQNIKLAFGCIVVAWLFSYFVLVIISDAIEDDLQKKTYMPQHGSKSRNVNKSKKFTIK